MPARLFNFNKSPSGEVAEYAFIDLQTTGLSTKWGEEDRIVQASWLVTDALMREVSRGTRIVWQESLGSLEARQVHHVTEQQMQAYGITEAQLLQELWAAVGEVPYWVCHNVAFDLGILQGTLRRCAPHTLDNLWKKQVICTMQYLPMVMAKQDYVPPYYKLTDLAMHLTGLTKREIMGVDVVSWRNVCLTRISLFILLRDYPDPEGKQGAMPASFYLGGA